MIKFFNICERVDIFIVKKIEVVVIGFLKGNGFRRIIKLEKTF